MYVYKKACVLSFVRTLHLIWWSLSLLSPSMKIWAHSLLINSWALVQKGLWPELFCASKVISIWGKQKTQEGIPQVNVGGENQLDSLLSLSNPLFLPSLFRVFSPHLPWFLCKWVRVLFLSLFNPMHQLRCSNFRCFHLTGSLLVSPAFSLGFYFWKLGFYFFCFVCDYLFLNSISDCCSYALWDFEIGWHKTLSFYAFALFIFAIALVMMVVLGLLKFQLSARAKFDYLSEERFIWS